MNDGFWTEAGFFVQLAVLFLALATAIGGFYRCWAARQSEIARWRSEIEKLVENNTHRNDLEGQDIGRLITRVGGHDDALRHKDTQLNDIATRLGQVEGELRRLNGAGSRH